MTQDHQPKEIIVVCFGNICRSPMGEVLLQRALDARFGEGEFLVSSAGIGADDGRPPSQGTIRTLQARGIDFRHGRSRYLTHAMAEAAWRIYCMEEYQVARVRSMLDPSNSDKVMLMGEEVPDPYGSPDTAYENVALHLERLIPSVVDDIVATLKSG